MELTLIIALGSAVAGFIQGLAGFGFGLASLAVWSWVIEPAVAVPVVVYGSLVGQLLAVSSMRRGFNLPRLIPFVIGGAVGVPIGMQLLQAMDPLFFKFGIGLLLAAYCTTLLCLQHIPRIHHGGKVADGFMGWVGGVMGGFGGIPAPVPTLWCALRGWPKDQQRSVFQAFNLFMHIITLAGLYLHGMITPAVVELFMIVTPIMLVPTILGIRLYHRMSDGTFRFILLSLLAMTGLGLLLTTTGDVVAVLLATAG